jgi:TetR/AcrR family transcriptional regulator, mexCD-oprJ operon repressor
VTSPRPVEFMRADAARNVHRIVEVAARLVGEDPHAGMIEVAAAAGVSRATVYRHFATREALIGAIQQQAVEQAKEALDSCRLEEGSATDALRRLVARWLELAERYSLPQLATQPGLDTSKAGRELRWAIFGQPLVALIERGQATGEFSADLPANWSARSFGSLVLAGARAIADGELTRADAPEAVFRTLVRGLSG